MSLDYFQLALKSLERFPGMVGVMGGEPTLHPDFEKISVAIREGRPEPENPAVTPVFNFVKYRNESLANVKRRRGLWTSLGPGYRKHYEIIQDVYGYQCVNDHSHAGEHRALLIDRKSLGIPDEQWLKYRDACWVQREWSASITPKGAFFCEVAGALDMLFNGPGGWDLTEDWWLRQPSEFGDQLQWCELCSACLPVPSRRASEGLDDVSDAMREKLEALGSKKPMVSFSTAGYREGNFSVNTSCEPYIPDGDNSVRVVGLNASVYRKDVTAIVVCSGYDDYLLRTLAYTKKAADRVVVVTEAADAKTRGVCDMYGISPVLSKRLHERGAKFAKGKAINEAMEIAKPEDWILLLDSDVILPPDFRRKLDTYVLNPGVLYYTRRWGPAKMSGVGSFLEQLGKGVSLSQLRGVASKEQARFEGRRGNAVEHFPFGYFQLFNVRALALRDRAAIYPENSETAENDDKDFGTRVFPKSKTVSLPIPEFDVIHLPHGMYRENWEGRKSPRLDSPESSTLLEFVCERTCAYGGRVYTAGERLKLSREEDLPRHFRRVQ